MEGSRPEKVGSYPSEKRGKQSASEYSKKEAPGGHARKRTPPISKPESDRSSIQKTQRGTYRGNTRTAGGGRR